MKKELKLELDLTNLSPMNQDKVLNILSDSLWKMYIDIEQGMVGFAEGEAKVDMAGWKDAANTVYNYVRNKKIEFKKK